MPAVLIALAAILLRTYLALNGGGYYSTDELIHFTPAVKAADAVAARDWDGAAVALIQQEHHMGFRLPSALVATAARLLAPASARQTVSVWLLSFASVAVIALIPALARRAGAGHAEALTAMLLATGATTLAYFSRHLAPYDTGLAIDLFALWLALGPLGRWRAIAVGAVACFGFLSYYAYLAVAALACLVHLLRSRSGVVGRAVGMAIGAAAVFACFELVTVTRGATIPWVNPFHIMLWRFLHGAPESWGSSYAEGWWVPWAYLWNVEHAVLVVWVASLVAGCLMGARRALFWGAIALGLYLWMVLHSTVLGESVVLGRFVRQIVPFLALGGAAGLVEVQRRVRERGGVHFARSTVVAGLVLYVGCAALNLRPVVSQWFPRDLEERWRREHPALAYDQTVVGPGGTQGQGRWVAFNVFRAGPPWPVTGVRGEPIPDCVVESHPHPLAWAGYQYEGYTEAARTAIRSHPYLMALVDTETKPPCPAAVPTR